MKVKQAMTPDVKLCSPQNTISEAARMMAECDSGVLPVGENDRLVGMITDRDIVIRAVAERLSPDTPVRDVMSAEVQYCFENDTIADLARHMGEQRVRRLPVLNADKRLVGIISLGDLAREARPSAAGEAVVGVSRPGGPHNQTMH